MISQSYRIVHSLLFGCLSCLVVSSFVNADGRVFVLDLRNSSGVQGFKDAEQACASKHARLASAEELRHAVVECFFSQCTRGWLYGGTVGTTVCNVVGSSLKAVAVRTENASEDMAHLGAFCVKDKGLPCGDPPSFPNALLQKHSGLEMGDELVYTCVSGYVMPSGQTAFSLLCDSCGEWYGAVQICVKDEPESHVDYEDKFTDSYEEADHEHESLEEAQEEPSEEAYDGKRSMEQQEKISNVKVQERHQEQQEEYDVEVKVTESPGAREGAVEEGAKNGELAFEDFTSRPRWEEEKIGLVSVDVPAATEEPVSVLSQKHMFWFPPEAFPEEEPPVSVDPVTQNPATQISQRASGGQSEESKEHESQERPQHPIPIDVDDHDDEPEGYDDHENDNDDRDEQDNSRHDHLDVHEDDHYDDQDDLDSHQKENHDDDDDDVKRPAQDREDRHKDHDDHDDHYDMGEHEEDRDRIRYSSKEYDDRDDTHDEHQSFEDHNNPTDDHSDNDGEYPDGSEERPDHDDHDDDKDHDMDHDDHDDKDDKLYDDRDSHEDDDHSHAIISGATEGRQNVTQRVPGGKATKDESWLDGYPVGVEETDDSKATTEPADGKSAVKTTDRPNEVEIRRPALHTSSPDTQESPTKAPGVEVEPSFTGAPAASPEHSDTPSYSDTLDYDTQQAAPTHSWLDDLTEHPFLDHGPAPPVQDGDTFTGAIGEHTVHNLPGETGERGESEGEMRETICVGEDCPPHPPSSSSQGPKVAAIIVAVCAVATAVIVGVWCYRRQQQKSSMYEMNGKGQSQARQGQHIEMQQKV